MEKVATGHSIKDSTHGPRAGALPSAARTDMQGLALFCAVAYNERRLVLDHFSASSSPGPEEPGMDLETVAGIIAVDVDA